MSDEEKSAVPPTGPDPQLRPRTGRGRRWLFATFTAILIGSAGYAVFHVVIHRSDGSSSGRFAIPETADKTAAPANPMEVGERLFKANCAVCHQPTGQGIAGAYPPLDGSEWVRGHPARVKRIVLRGIEGPVQAKGTTYNSPMPAFDRLRDHQIAAILTFVRNSWSNAAGEISPASVTATRQAIGSRGMPWSANELLAITDDDHHEPGAAPSTSAAP